MSDEEEESMSEGFSASEDEWKPTKGTRGGESSDDDDSDFETTQKPSSQNSASGNKKKETKSRGATKQGAVKKRKPPGQSLRTKLYNKYRPPPKTMNSPSSLTSNSPSTSKTASKNAKMPNECNERIADDDSSSDSSLGNNYVDPNNISYFDFEMTSKQKSTSPVPIFDCNAGIEHLTDSDSDSEDNDASSGGDDGDGKSKPFDFRHLLEKANSLERARENEEKNLPTVKGDNNARLKVQKSNDSPAIDINSILALGEKQSKTSMEDHESLDENEPHRLNKTKSRRVKRQKKARSVLGKSGGNGDGDNVGGDTDDSDWEEVADDKSIDVNTSDIKIAENLEIHVENVTKNRKKTTKSQQELENAIKRKINRQLKDRQLLMHKTTLLCCFARNYHYNRLLNDRRLMEMSLKLLPTKNAYPPERGTEIKYYQSLTTWFKTAIKLKSTQLYPEEVPRKKSQVHKDLMEQIVTKEASCKQDMVFILVILLRGMGLQCRLIANMQPLPLKPAQTDLLTVKLKAEKDDSKDKQSKKSTDEAETSFNKSAEQKKQKIKNENIKPNLDKLKLNNSSEKIKTEKLDSIIKVEHQQIKLEVESKIKEEIESGSSRIRASKRNQIIDNHTSDIIEEKRIKFGKLKGLSSESEQSSISNVLKPTEEAKSTETTNKKATKITETANNALKSTKNTIKSTATTLKSVSSTRTTKNKASVDEPTKTSLNSKAIKQNDQKSVEQTSVNNDPNIASTTSSKRIPKTTLKNASMQMEVKSDTTINDLEQSEEIHIVQTLNGDVPTVEKSKLKKNASKTTAKTSNTDNLTEQSTVKTVKLIKEAETKRLQITDKTNSNFLKTDEKVEKLTPIARQTRKASTEQTTPKIHIEKIPTSTQQDNTISTRSERNTRSRSKSPRLQISPTFLQTAKYKEKFPEQSTEKISKKRTSLKLNDNKIRISPKFLTATTDSPDTPPKRRVLRSRQKSNETAGNSLSKTNKVPQLDGVDDDVVAERKPNKKLNKTRSKEESDEDFKPSPPKKHKKQAPLLPKSVQQLKRDNRLLSTDNEENSGEKLSTKKLTAADYWIEVWSDVEEQWVCIDLFKGKVNSVESIRQSASNSLAYVYAYQNDLSIKDVTARYCPHWSNTVRKARVEKLWLEEAIVTYLGQFTKRDIREDQELKRIHESKPLPTAISDFKDHPLYVLKRHLLKFQALYPPEAPSLGFIRGEAIYSRDCVHTLHSREIWLKQARTVKLGELPYKIVKARPKWDKYSQTVIKDQPLDIFGYWQTEDYDPPTAEDGIVPRNAYGNVELFKACMLPKKTVHLRLPGLNRICKKMGIDCANAVIGFDFHQGSCHPTFDGFVVCEEFGDQVTAAWYQEQEEQERKVQEKHEARIYGNWKKLIRGLLIRERLKKKYNF